MRLTVRQLKTIIAECAADYEFSNTIEEGWKDKFKRFLPIATLSLSMFGCHWEPNKFKTHGFTEDEIAVIQDAVDEWCEVTNKTHCVVIGDEGDSDLKLVAQIDKKDANGKPLDVWGLRHEKDGQGDSEISIKDMRNDPDWLVKLHDLVQHELGHHFARKSNHLKPGHRMASHYGDESPYITQSDIDYANNKVNPEDLEK